MVKEFWKSVNIWWSYGQVSRFFMTHGVVGQLRHIHSVAKSHSWWRHCWLGWLTVLIMSVPWTARNCFYQLRHLRQISRYAGQDVAMQLVSALILSRLDYCNSFLTGLHKPIWLYYSVSRMLQPGWFLNCNHVVVSVMHYVSCTGCQLTFKSNSSCAYWCTVHIPAGVRSIWQMFLSQLQSTISD